jgi:hypothetical protein
MQQIWYVLFIDPADMPRETKRTIPSIHNEYSVQKINAKQYMFHPT